MKVHDVRIIMKIMNSISYRRGLPITVSKYFYLSGFCFPRQVILWVTSEIKSFKETRYVKKEKRFLKTKWFLWHWNHESSAWIIMVKILLLFKLIKFSSSLILFNPTLVCVRNDALFCWFWDHLQRLLRNLCLSTLSSCVK